MINTIFYFPESLTYDQYLNVLDKESEDGIASRTIVFARHQGMIYNNGAIFGSIPGLVDYEEFADTTSTLRERLENLLRDTIAQTNTNLDSVQADLLQQLQQLGDDIEDEIDETRTGIENTISVLREETNGAIARLKVETLSDVNDGFVSKANLTTYVTNSLHDEIGISSLSDIALKSDVTSSATTVTNALRSETEGAISRMKSEVLDDVDDGFVSKADISTYVTDTIKDETGVSSLSDIALKSDITASEASINTRFTDVNSSLSTLSLQSNADHSKISAIADWTGWSEGQPVQFSGGLVTEANADSIISALVANSSSDTYAAISTYADVDTSKITLTADKVYLDANTTLAHTIQATAGSIAGFTIQNNKLSAAQGTSSIELTPLHFATFNNNTLTNEINSDGSGSIASGGISWTNNGTITLSQEFLRSLFSELHNGAVNQNTYGGINEEFTIGQIGAGGNRQRYILFDPTTNALNEASYFDNSYDIYYSPRENYYESITRQIFQGSEYATLTSNGYQLKGLADINYPTYGTLQEKQNYYFRNYKITGVFQSGILTSKKYIDPDTNLQKTDLSEVYLDHQIYFLYVPSLSDIAQVNQLDLNKFVGYAVSRSYQGSNPYAEWYTTTSSTNHAIDMSQATGIYAYITDIVDHGSYASYTGSLDTNNNNYYILPNNRVGITNNSTVKEGTIDHFVFLPSSTYSPGSQYEIFNNPVEGSWGFVKFADALDSNTGERLGDIFFNKGIPASQNGTSYGSVTANFSSTTDSFSLNVPSYYLGFLVVYRSGRWIPLPNPICPQPRISQYRGNETE